MIDAIYLAQVNDTTNVKAPIVMEKKVTEIEQSGIIHSKVAGRFDAVKELPKEANSFNEMFDYADAFGKFRLSYIDSAHKISALPSKTQKHATAFGGEFGFDTAELNGFKAHFVAYVSQSVDFVNPDKEDLNEDFFAKDLNSFAYIAEASIDYNSDLFQTKIGRIKAETPFANSDDIRMAANTFEGAWANIDYTKSLKTQLFYFNRWAGYDSQDEGAKTYQNEFKDLVSSESFGMAGASLTYEYAKNSEATFWYNHIDKQASIAYGEIIGIYFIDGEDVHLDYGFQATNIQELDNSNIAGNVFGAMSIFHYNGVFLGGAYNIALSDKDEFITNGFGGGPYYTSLDEATISAISESAATSGLQTKDNNNEAFRIGVGYEFQNQLLDGLVFELVYGELYNGLGRITERNAIVTYDITDRWYLEAIYTDYKSSCNNNTFDRSLARLEYKF
nr:porin [uncultured Sulfurimonas sp.]